MSANYARIVRRSAVFTAVAAAVMVAACAAIGGTRGLVGALLGVALVVAFFGISVTVVGRAARSGPQAMMLAAIVTYTVKIVVLAMLVAWLGGADLAFDPRLFAVTAIACVLVWSAAQVFTSMRMRVLYFHPDGDR
jgi:ATP synthase protein I